MSEIKLELRERNEAIAMAYTKGYQQGRADMLMPYDVESIDELIVNARNKAIDEFVAFANTMPTVECEDGEIRPMWLEEMAEKLKEQKNE